jgi:hypothetical protein
MLEKPSSLTPREFYLRYLETCQLYIGILGERDSPGTEEEYREAVTTGLKRWVFIKQADSRGDQIQHLIEIAEREVREKFTGDKDLQDKIDQRIQNYLSQTTREYLELRKQRTHEFLTDYRTKFLEPLLEQVQLVRTQLRGGQTIQFGDYWRPDKITNHPHYIVDPELKATLDTFFTVFTKCEFSTAPAAKTFEENCGKVADFHLIDHIKQPDIRKNMCSQVVTSLDQTPLMYYQSLSDLKEEDLARIARHAGEGVAIALQNRSILSSINFQRSLREIVRGVVEMNQRSEEIRTYIAARRELEAAANKAHELLWKRFVESTGYQPIP